MNYPGGKGGVYQRLINLIPPHEVYIESHLGGGAVMRYKRSATRSIGIDIDPKTIELWTCSNPIGFDLVQGDAITFLKSYPFTGKEMVYCDPPYIRETRKKYYPIYKYEYTYEQHIELLKVIKSLPCMVMLSGYKSKLYAESLKGWHTYSFRAACHHGMATEYLWMNYPPPVKLHDYRYLGDTYRDRERIKLKSERWIRRFRVIPVLERQSILADIQELDKSKQEKEIREYL